MAKSASSKTQTPEKVPKVKKTANSIVRGHPLDNIINNARKRHPTQRLLESVASTNRTKRTKKPKVAPAKKKVKRLNTMQVTAKEGQEFLDNAATPTKASAGKGRTRSPGPNSDAKQKAKGEKSRSRSKSKKSSKAGGAGKSKSTKKVLNRTHTMKQTLADSKKLLKGGKPKGRTRSKSAKKK